MATYTSKCKKFITLDEGDSVILEHKTVWQLSCCDCGLTHDIMVELIGSPHKVKVTLVRNKQSTGQIRRWLPKKVKKAIEVIKKHS